MGGWLTVYGGASRAMGGASKVLEGTRVGAMLFEKTLRRRLVAAFIAGGIADVTVPDPYGPRMATLLKEVPGLGQVVPEFMASTDPDAPHWEGRLANAIEGLMLGAVLEGAVRAAQTEPARRLFAEIQIQAMRADRALLKGLLQKMKGMWHQQHMAARAVGGEKAQPVPEPRDKPVPEATKGNEAQQAFNEVLAGVETTPVPTQAISQRLGLPDRGLTAENREAFRAETEQAIEQARMQEVRAAVEEAEGIEPVEITEPHFPTQGAALADLRARAANPLELVRGTPEEWGRADGGMRALLSDSLGGGPAGDAHADEHTALAARLLAFWIKKWGNAVYENLDTRLEMPEIGTHGADVEEFLDAGYDDLAEMAKEDGTVFGPDPSIVQTLLTQGIERLQALRAAAGENAAMLQGRKEDLAKQAENDATKVALKEKLYALGKQVEDRKAGYEALLRMAARRHIATEPHPRHRRRVMVKDAQGNEREAIVPGVRDWTRANYQAIRSQSASDQWGPVYAQRLLERYPDELLPAEIEGCAATTSGSVPRRSSLRPDGWRSRRASLSGGGRRGRGVSRSGPMTTRRSRARTRIGRLRRVSGPQSRTAGSMPGGRRGSGTRAGSRPTMPRRCRRRRSTRCWRRPRGARPSRRPWRRRASSS